MSRRGRDIFQDFRLIVAASMAAGFILQFVPGAKETVVALIVVFGVLSVAFLLFALISGSIWWSKRQPKENDQILITKVTDLSSAGIRDAVEGAAARYMPPIPVRVPARTPSLDEKLSAIDWFQFEKLMAAVFRKKGYAVERRGGAKADDGIDLIIIKNDVTTAVQCKHWKTWRVPTPKVRELLGAMTAAGIAKGMLVSLKGYTSEARDKARQYGIETLDKHDVLTLLIEVDAAFDPAIIQLLDDQRKFCPRCEHEMVLRTAQRGAAAGGEFWGCSRYPRCDYVLELSSSRNN